MESGVNETLKDIEIPGLSGEEVVVGRHESGIMLEEGANTSTGRNYCANCKRNIHCYVKVDRETHEAIIKKTCKSDDCECKCRTHFACKRCGKLHPYGETCNADFLEERDYDPKAQKQFEKMMKKWKESHKNESKVVKKKE